MSHPTDAERKAVGERLKRAREARGASVGETANAASVARIHMYQLESGDSAPSIVTLAPAG